MSYFEQLFISIISGQLSEKQIAEEMKNPAFVAYYKQRI